MFNMPLPTHRKVAKPYTTGKKYDDRTGIMQSHAEREDDFFLTEIEKKNVLIFGMHVGRMNGTGQRQSQSKITSMTYVDSNI